MKYEVAIGAHTRSVSIERDAAGELRIAIERPAANGEGAKTFVAVEALPIGADSFSILLQGAPSEAQVIYETQLSYDTQVISEPRGLTVLCAGREFHAAVRDPRAWKGWKQDGRGLQHTQARQEVVAPMPGKIVRVLVTAGQNVEAGQGLIVVEAMKMQNEIRATKTGQATRILVREGQTVSAGEPLLVIT